MVLERIKSDSNIYQLAIRAVPADLKLCKTEWDVLTEIDGESTIRDISKKAKMKTNVVKLAVYNLLEEYLIEQIELPTDIYVDVQEIKKIEVQLVRILGPVAGIVIDDVLADMKLTRSTIKKDDLYMFVETVSNEITDGTKKVQFQEQMLENMNAIMES
jgi:hypothetical protein